MRSVRWLFNGNTFPVLIVILFAVLAARSLLFESGYFNMHDDLQMMRQLEMEKCFLDRQIPCRWVPDMGYGFGYPLFNFYPPLPYLIGQGIRVMGFSFVTTAKLLFALSFIFSGVAMYLLTKDFFGRLGGVLAAVFYIWAPYHSVDVYVRGAMNEAWALVFFPLILWTSHRLIRSDKHKSLNWIIALALSLFGLLTSHNLMVMIFAPVVAGWVLLILILHKGWKKIPYIVISGILALGLSAFFTLPVFIESGLTIVDQITVGYYNYTVHFVSLRQLLFSRFWGYGPSTWLEEDRMSFQIGHFHWISSLVVGLFAFITLLTKKGNLWTRIKSSNLLLITSYLLIVGWASAFMTHLKSTPIWLAIKPLEFVQFPWRFLAITIFSFSFVIGFLPGFLHEIAKRKWFFIRAASIWVQLSIVVLLSLSLIIANWAYFKPEYGEMGPLTDEEKFSGLAWEKQQTSGIYDYLPKTAKTAPKSQRVVVAEFTDKEGEISKIDEGTNWTRFTVKSEEESVIRINILDFPEWRIFVDGGAIEKFIPTNEEWGRIHLRVPAGEHQVYAELFDTPIRTYSNYISLISWLTLGLIVVLRNRLKRFT